MLIPRFSQRSGGFELNLFGKRGFTLIELLVVIAIVILLVAVVIVRTGTIKKKGEDAAVQEGMRELKKAAELYYSANATYEGVCDLTDTTLSGSGSFGIIKDYLDKYNGREGVIGCKDGKEAYAVISSMNTKDCWCVDSEGISKEVDLAGAGDCQEKLTGASCP